MWSPRVQSDRMLFVQHWRERLEKTPMLDFYQEMVTNLLCDGDSVAGVITSTGLSIPSKICCVDQRNISQWFDSISIEKNFGGGRAGESASLGLTAVLEQGFVSGRMKTGTPPRVDGRSIDFSKMEEQPGDPSPGTFSYSEELRL